MALKNTLLVTLSISALAVTTGCAPGRGAAQDNITVVGSTAMQPLVEQAATQYMAKHPKVRIVVQGGGSGTGLTQVVQGAATIGDSDIFAQEKPGVNAANLVDHRVCVVGFAAVVNPAISCDNLTKTQLTDIFTGKTTNWKTVGGPDQKIVLVNRPKSSGTRATFKEFALDGAEEAPGIEEDSSGTARKIIHDTPGAIGYLALSYVNASVKALKLDGFAANATNITSGKYPVWGYEHSYTKGAPDPATAKFLNYMMTDAVQKTIVPQLGYIPATEMKVTRNAAGVVTRH